MKNIRLPSWIAFTIIFGLASIVGTFIWAYSQQEIAEPDGGVVATRPPAVAEERGAKSAGFRKIKEEANSIYYQGEVVLSGEYYEFEPNKFLGGIVCFDPDQETEYLIPREADDNRTRWFCFNDQDRIKKSFGINEDIFEKNGCIQGDVYDLKCRIFGSATIKISNYTAVTLETAATDEADLVEIIEFTRPGFSFL